MSLTWQQVRDWRLRRQLLAPRPAVDSASTSDEVGAVVARLCGVQAQLLSAAELAVAVRQDERHGRIGQVGQALAQRRLLRTWAMRGALHLLHPADAPAYLALLAGNRTWERPAWQRAFLPTDRLTMLNDAAAAALDGRCLTREQLSAEVAQRTGDAALTSGWGTVLKPLAWQGLLCQASTEGGRVTFTRPDTWLPQWQMPEAAQAARVVLPAYLAVFGPASPAAFDAWLSRGATSKPTLRSWFDDLGDELCLVDVEGQPLYARTADTEELADTRPEVTVRLLPAFDQYVLGPGTNDPHTVPAAGRARVSRAAGWISPTVVTGDGVVGTWQVEDDRLEVDLFGDAPPLNSDGLEAEFDRIGRLLDAPLRLSVTLD